MLKREEDSGELKIVREDLGFDLVREAWNTASHATENEIYALQKEKL